MQDWLGLTIPDGVSYFVNFFMGGVNDESTETPVRTQWKTAGTIEKFFALLYFNDMGSSATIILRQNSLDSASTISVPANTTGAFVDSVNTVSVAVDDLMSVNFNFPVTGTGADVASIGGLFEPASGNAYMMGGYEAGDFTGTLQYISIAEGQTYVTVESEAQCRVPISLSVTTARMYVTTNTGAEATITLRKNAVDTDIAVTVPASTTGSFTDTGAASFVAGDEINWKLTSAGTPAVEFTNREMLVEDSASGKIWFLSDEATGELNSDPTSYYRLVGELQDEPSADIAYAYMPIAITLSDFYVRIHDNTLTGATTLQTFVNGAAGNQSVSVPASTSGNYTDASNTDVLSATDKVCVQCIEGGTGSLYIQQIGHVGQTASGETSFFSREVNSSLPLTKNALTNFYSPTDETNVATDDDVFVEQVSTDAAYILHQWKYEHTNATDPITVTVRVKSDLAPTIAAVTLQIWNNNTSAWETIATNSTAGSGAEFQLSGTITASVANYYDGANNQIAARVYQQRT